MDKDVLHQVERILGQEFTDEALIAKAFTHSSAVISARQ
jgi:dsRNA-specific ribonuclease